MAEDRKGSPVGGAEALAAHVKAFGDRTEGRFIVSHREPQSHWLVGNKERNLLAQVAPESKGVWYQAWLGPGGHWDFVSVGVLLWPPGWLVKEVSLFQ